MLRFLLVPSVALFVLTSVSPSTTRANDFPVRLDFTFRFDVDVGNRPQYKNLAPWYSYFPYDPHIHGRAQQFPNWPQTWPPVAPMPKKAALTPAPTATPVSYRPTYSAVQPASWSQPAGYYPAPSYWYGR